MLIPLHISQNCTLRVPDVDRGPADPKNFFAVVMAECEGLYTLLVAEKENWHLSLQLQIYKTAVTKARGGQGYVKCMSLSGCSSGRCSCSRKRNLCCTEYNVKTSTKMTFCPFSGIWEKQKNSHMCCFSFPFAGQLHKHRQFEVAPHSKFCRHIITFLTSNPEVYIKSSSNKFSYKSLEHDFTYDQERNQIITDILRIQSDGPKYARDYNLKNQYGEACHLFLTFCEECHKKRARKLPKSLVVKPLVSTNLMSRAQFCILSPLKSKRAEEVALKLLEIFLTFGASSILQSDDELKLVTGRPRHPQSQGAVERLNGVVQDKLAIWMRENECKICSVTFGEEPRIGLESYVLPKSLVDAAKTEEEIEEFLTSQEANDETFIKARKEAASGQTRAAAKMTRRSKKMLIPLQIGQNCTLRVPDVDRGPADPKNFLAVVMAECEGLYTVGCREGKLASKFTAADLQVISENLLSIDEVPDTEIPLRTAVTKATGGQGYVKCMCLSGCSSGRCSCSRKRVLCNSRCHPGKSCKNI
ncbi:KRAB-A domain-containing protein 2 [Trichinella nelsoni]|uniref:KRAB-A domain-containing protein 2 n=2 Tax=Trichinella TaxID=6333 RepID=A0A0V0RJG8_9BILA|nr:KRAB-A domain-containing protein 2 [Trichinella nelsoni]